MPEIAELLGDGTAIELKALLVVPGATNFRNDIAHGLLSDDEAWSYRALYVWWLCLRIALLPALHMLSPEGEETSRSDGAGE